MDVKAVEMKMDRGGDRWSRKKQRQEAGDGSERGGAIGSGGGG
jgi:hypothetical protein